MFTEAKQKKWCMLNLESQVTPKENIALLCMQWQLKNCAELKQNFIVQINNLLA